MCEHRDDVLNVKIIQKNLKVALINVRKLLYTWKLDLWLFAIKERINHFLLVSNRSRNLEHNVEQVLF